MKRLTADEIRALVKANYTPPVYYKARKSPPINLDDLCDDVVRFYNGDRDQSKIKTTRNTINYNMKKTPIIWETREPCDHYERYKKQERHFNGKESYENDSLLQIFNNWINTAIKTRPAWAY